MKALLFLILALPLMISAQEDKNKEIKPYDSMNIGDNEMKPSGKMETDEIKGLKPSGELKYGESEEKAEPAVTEESKESNKQQEKY